MPRVSPQFLSQDVLNAQQVNYQQFRFINIIPAFQDNESAMQFLARLGLGLGLGQSQVLFIK